MRAGDKRIRDGFLEEDATGSSCTGRVLEPGPPCAPPPQGSSSQGNRRAHVSSPALSPHPHLGPTLQVPDSHSSSYPSLLSHLTSVHLNAPVLALPVAKRQRPAPSLRSFHPLAASLPCDFHLLNLRALHAEVSTPLGPAPPGPGAGPSSPRLLCPCPASAQGSRVQQPPPHLHSHTQARAHTHSHTASVPPAIQDDALPSAEAALILHRKGFDCGLEAKNLGFNCTTSQGKVSRAQVWEEPRTRGGGREMGQLGRAGVREARLVSLPWGWPQSQGRGRSGPRQGERGKPWTQLTFKTVEGWRTSSPGGS